MSDLFSYFLIALAFSEGIVAILLLNISKRQNEDRKAYMTAEKETYKTLEKVVSQTTKESQAILQQALNTQKNLIGTIELFERSLEKQMLTTLRTFGTKLEQVGSEHVKKSSTELAQILEVQNTQLKVETTSQMADFSKQTQALIEEYRQMLMTQAISEQKATQAKLASIVEDEKQRLSQKADVLIKKVTQNYLLQNVDTEDTHAVVMKLIEAELK